MKLFYVLTWTILSHTAFSWDTDDLELFDLVEDVNKNFYDVLGVPSVSNLLSITHELPYVREEIIITTIPRLQPFWDCIRPRSLRRIFGLLSFHHIGLKTLNAFFKRIHDVLFLLEHPDAHL